MTALSQSLSAFMTDDPALRMMQGGILLLAFFLLFLLFWTLKDILLRTRSFAFQFGCVLLVAALPLVGFLLYLLVRPARTIRERDVEEMLRRLTGEPELMQDDAEPPEPPMHSSPTIV